MRGWTGRLTEAADPSVIVYGRMAPLSDLEAVAAGHWALLAGGVGNVGLARYGSTARVSWRRTDALGEHVELEWRSSRETLEHGLVTGRSGAPTAYWSGAPATRSGPTIEGPVAATELAASLPERHIGTPAGCPPPRAG